MNDNDEASPRDTHTEAVDALRLKARITAVIGRIPKPVPVNRDDGTVLLKGRRRIDRAPDAADRRSSERRCK